MYITPVHNISLLKAIYQLKNCTIEELKDYYLPPEQPGIIQGVTVSFDSDLQTLKEMGCVSVEENRVSFLNWP